MKRYCIFTVDTESDNQWDTASNQSTSNAKCIPLFQEICNKYGFKPVYLIDYSMLKDDYLVDFLQKTKKNEECEIGLHLHAWDTPPFFGIEKTSTARPFLYNFSINQMEQKLHAIDRIIKERFGSDVISHRAGRWAMNSDYALLLEKYGYRVDCSVTPGINWFVANSVGKDGPNYKKWEKQSGVFPEANSLYEVPLTVERIHCFNKSVNSFMGLIRGLYHLIFGRMISLRPALFCFEELKKCINRCYKNGREYIELMIHSSELLPGGSPYFNEKTIDSFYLRLEQTMSYIIDMGYEPVTLSEYYLMKISGTGNAE